jgi:hypothetical protein
MQFKKFRGNKHIKNWISVPYSIKMSNLDLLILDYLKAYADDNIPLTIDSSSAQSAQSETSIDVSFPPEQRLFEMQPMLVEKPSPSG